MRVEPDPWSLALRLYGSGEELLPGLHDGEVLKRVEGLIEEAARGLLGEVRRFHMPTLAWRLREAACEPCGEAVVAPYVEEFDVEGWVEALPGDPSNPAAWRGYRGLPIVLAEEPQNPDDLVRAVLLAAEEGAEALLLCPRGAPRVIVTTGSWGYSFNVGAPTPIAVAYVDPHSCATLKRAGRARLYIDARTVETVTWGLQARLPGRGRPWLFGAHWDRWPGGFQDDTLGVAQAIAAAVNAASRGLEAHVLVFPSEEHGSPGYAGWYWSWGSRFYSIQLKRSGLAGEYAGYINFDVAGSTPLIVSGSPQLLASLPPGGWKARPWECPECDSMQLAVHAGLPTLSIHTLWTPRAEAIYHTRLDTPERAEPGAARAAVNLAVRAALAGPRWECMEAMVTGLLGRGPLRARRLAALILQASKRVGWETLYPVLAREALRPIDYGSRRWSSGPLEAYWFPEASLLPRLLSDLRGGRDPGEVWVAGWEYPLYTTRPSPGSRPCSVECVMAQARSQIEALSERLEDALRSLLA